MRLQHSVYNIYLIKNFLSQFDYLILDNVLKVIKYDGTHLFVIIAQHGESWLFVLQYKNVSNFCTMWCLQNKIVEQHFIIIQKINLRHISPHRYFALLNFELRSILIVTYCNISSLFATYQTEA